MLIFRQFRGFEEFRTPSVDSNPRLMIVARMISGVTHQLEEAKPDVVRRTAASNKPFFTDGGQIVDTLTDTQETVFVKCHINEVYPETVRRNEAG